MVHQWSMFVGEFFSACPNFEKVSLLDKLKVSPIFRTALFSRSRAFCLLGVTSHGGRGVVSLTCWTLDHTHWSCWLQVEKNHKPRIQPIENPSESIFNHNSTFNQLESHLKSLNVSPFLLLNFQFPKHVSTADVISVVFYVCVCGACHSDCKAGRLLCWHI